MKIEFPLITGTHVSVDLTAFTNLLNELFAGKLLIEDIGKICSAIFDAISHNLGHEAAIASFDFVLALLKNTRVIS